jgi:pimeloyl-ACP methyl ester carboxylesterase
LKIYLVETNGLPNLSDGSSPDIKSLDYGWWAAEIFEKLGIHKAFVAGASFGGLIAMKLAVVKPELIKAAFLLNAGCLQPFSLSFKNLYYNLLPIISPSEKNVAAFLDKAVFCKPNHKLSSASEKMIIDYEVFALKKYKDNTQKPYYLNEELAAVESDVYLVQGDKDLLFPYQKSIANAKKHLKNIKEIKIFENVGHGIETYAEAMNYIGFKIKNHN